MSLGVSNIKGADQPVHPRSLISAFVIRLLKIILSRLATSDIAILASLCSRGDWPGVGLCWKPQRQVLSRRGPT